MGLPQQTWVKNTAHGLETHETCAKKFHGVAISKEGDADSLLWHERTHRYYFS